MCALMCVCVYVCVSVCVRVQLYVACSRLVPCVTFSFLDFRDAGTLRVDCLDESNHSHRSRFKQIDLTVTVTES